MTKHQRHEHVRLILFGCLFVILLENFLLVDLDHIFQSLLVVLNDDILALLKGPTVLRFLVIDVLELELLQALITVDWPLVLFLEALIESSHLKDLSLQAHIILNAPQHLPVLEAKHGLVLVSAFLLDHTKRVVVEPIALREFLHLELRREYYLGALENVINENLLRHIDLFQNNLDKGALAEA